MKKRIGVVLSGCGVKDGSEIHEAVLTLLAIDRHGGQSICMAPDMEFDEISHLTGTPTGARRNVLVESARIARGAIRNLKEMTASDLDAVMFPGGFGAASNLCTFATHGARATIHPEVLRLLREMVAAAKPIGALCIAPALIATAFGPDLHPMVTIGNHPDTADAIRQTGSRHLDCPVNEYVVDAEHKIVSSPVYMLTSSISQAADAIDATVRAVINMS